MKIKKKRENIYFFLEKEKKISKAERKIENTAK